MPRDGLVSLNGRTLRLVAGAAVVGAIMAALWAAGVFDSADAGDAGFEIRSATTDIETPGSDGREIGLREGDLAPNFEATDFQGRRLRLADFRGQAVLLNFWATWCIPCRAEMPEIQQLYGQYRDEGFVVLALNYGESLDRAQAFVDEFTLEFTAFLLDPSLAVVNRYALQGMPMSYFIDADGVITRVHVGRATFEQLEDGTLEALRGNESGAAGR